MKSIELHSVQADEFNQNPVLETVKNSPVIPKTKLDYGKAVLTKDTQIKGDIKCLANWGAWVDSGHCCEDRFFFAAARPKRELSH